jgi:hypothetical protein
MVLNFYIDLEEGTNPDLTERLGKLTKNKDGIRLGGNPA